MRRGSSQTQSLLLRGQSTKTPRDWKSFLSNVESKRNFINLLLQLWEDDKYAEQLKDREIMFASAEQCTRLTSSDGVTTESNIVHSLCSSHEESANFLSDLEQFVCFKNGKPTYSDVNKLRFDMARQRFQTGPGNVLTNSDGIDFSLLPPCRSTLQMHIKRVNYQTLLWKKSTISFPDLPPAEEHGWKVTLDGDLDYNWCAGDLKIWWISCQAISQKMMKMMFVTVFQMSLTVTVRTVTMKRVTVKNKTNQLLLRSCCNVSSRSKRMCVCVCMWVRERETEREREREMYML